MRRSLLGYQRSFIWLSSLFISGEMSYLLPKLTTKTEVDHAIKSTEDVVLVMRFGRDDDPVCMQLDNIVRAYFYVHLLCHRFSWFYFHFRFDSCKTLSIFYLSVSVCLPVRKQQPKTV